VKLAESTGVKKFVWDEQNYLAETDSANDTQVVYTNEPRRYGNLVSQRRLTSGVWTPHWHHFDAIGSTRELTTSGQVVSDTRLYDAWGTQVASSGIVGTTLAYIGVLEYVADSDSDLLYARARFFRCVNARWLSVDPIDLALSRLDPDGRSDELASATSIERQKAPKGPHTYVYVGNNPISRTDPSGLVESTRTVAGPMPSPLPSAGGCIVSVCCRRVEVDPTGIGTHCFVLVTQPSGQRTSYGGYAHKVGPAGCERILIACARPFPQPGSSAGETFPGEPSGATYSCFHLGTLPCQPTFDCLDSGRHWFHAKCCCYAAVLPGRPNSNTVARTLLARCVDGRDGIHVPSGNPRGWPTWAPKYDPLPIDQNCEAAPAICCNNPPPGCGND
jgi:hypothetical protein